MRKVEVCIPSWHRPECKTLGIIPWARVYVDPSDVEAYRERYPQADIVECPAGVQGNLCRVRNHIMDAETERGTWGVVIIDDDASQLDRFSCRGIDVPGYDRIVLGEDGIAGLIAEGFTLCSDYGYRFWGLNPTNMPNAACRNVPFNTSAYIPGPFQAFILEDMPLRYDEELPLKEDYDMTLQQCARYRGCLRLNNYFLVCEQACKGNQSGGGCTPSRTSRREVEQLEMLQRKWGTKIVRTGKSKRRMYDMNPTLHIPIKGV